VSSWAQRRISRTSRDRREILRCAQNDRRDKANGLDDTPAREAPAARFLRSARESVSPAADPIGVVLSAAGQVGAEAETNHPARSERGKCLCDFPAGGT